MNQFHKKAVIFGSVGVNRGDDLMNRVLANACRESGFSPVVAAIDPAFQMRVYGQDAFLSSKRGIKTWLKEIQSSDCVIIGGGTLIQNDFNKGRLSGILMYALSAMLISKVVFRKPTYLLGVGVNRVSWLNKVVSKLFRFADLIIVRDQASIENAASIGGFGNVKKFWDVGLCKSLYDRDGHVDEVVVSPVDDYVCLSLAKEKNKEKALHVGRLVVRYARERGYGVRLVAMDVRDSEELSLYAELIESEGEECVSLIVPVTPYELIPVIKGARSCVGMRLHFCVLCLVYGISPVVVSREQKSEWIRYFVGNKRLIQFDDVSLDSKIMAALECVADNRLSGEKVAELNRIDAELKALLTSTISGCAA